MKILKAMMKNSAHKRSARPTTPATASVWIGWIANKIVAEIITFWSKSANSFGNKSNRAQQTMQWIHKLVHFIRLAIVSESNNRYSMLNMSVVIGRYDLWLDALVNATPQKSCFETFLMVWKNGRVVLVTSSFRTTATKSSKTNSLWFIDAGLNPITHKKTINVMY